MRSNTSPMGRPRVHDDDAILDAARTLVIRSGTTAATVSAIAEASGAPMGSLYHRFGSRDALLSETWMRAVRRSQQPWLEALERTSARDGAVDAGLSIFDFCRSHFDDARLLVAGAPPELRAELRRINEPAVAALRVVAKRMWGHARAEDVELLLLATVDLPLGAVRRHLSSGTMPPVSLRAPLEAAVRAALKAR